MFRFFSRVRTSKQQSRPELVGQAAQLHRQGIQNVAEAREAIATIYDGYNFSEDAVVQQRVLADRIENALRDYRADDKAYKYFHGHPYQGLAIAGVFGDRVCDYRFDAYELRRFITPSDRVLDIGCNCGFMAILAAYRIGCRADGIDINPHMVAIGRLVAEHLRVSDLVNLHAGRLQDFHATDLYDVVMSFATHWTDDNNYRVSLDEHMSRMGSYLRPGGTLIFETHCNDVGKPEFYDALDGCRDRFTFDGLFKKVDSDTRELYILKRV